MELINFELDAISSTEPLDEIVQQRCLVILLYKNNKQILIAPHRRPSEKKQTRPFNSQRGDCISRGRQTHCLSKAKKSG